jgi:MYXO-CTERM domain-containing protein
VEALFIDPTGGTTVSLGDDAESGAIGLGFTFPFFSDTFSETRIVSNGFLRFGTSPPTYYDNQALPQGVLVHIAPFWDDLAPNGGGTISYRGDATFFAATWDGVPLAYGGGKLATFQATLLGAGNIYGESAGTIVFTYGTLDGVAANGSATVGLNQGDNTHYATYTPLGSDGLITSDELATLSAFNSASNAIIFRPHGTGGYNVTGGPVPEASTVVLFAVGLIGLGGYARIRRRRSAVP